MPPSTLNRRMQDTLSRHERIALCFSGGKDSTACLCLLREYLPRITVYHLDPGDLLPEIREVAAWARTLAPNFVHIQGDVLAAIDRDGLPTDLLPFSEHPVGQGFGEGGPVRLVSRYECCFKNLMWPLFQRVADDGNTLLVRGTKRADKPRLPMLSGQQAGGIELLCPIEDWSHADVLAFLMQRGAPVARLYRHMENAPECARCSAWWSEGRAAYLRRYHPALHESHQARLRAVVDAIEGPLAQLRREIAPSAAPSTVGDP